MKHDDSLIRGLTLSHAIALVVGGVIGTGVFLKSAAMAQQLESATWVLAAWVAAGVLSLAGALTYAELGAMFPETGGDYVYLHRAYGRLPAFLWGWMIIAVAAPGSIAALSTGFSIFLSSIAPMGAPWIERDFTALGQKGHWEFGWRQVVSVAAIAVFSAVNCLGVRFGGRLQTALTIAKLLGIVLLVAGVFALSSEARFDRLDLFERPPLTGVQAFGAAMIAALWAYNGWNVLTMAAGEIRDPERNVPRSLAIGMLIVTVVYLSANLSYFCALPLDEAKTSYSTAHPDAPAIAAKAASTFSGSAGVKLVAAIFVISTLGALNQTILGMSRVPYVMARDGLFFSGISKVSESRRAPTRAIALQGVLASAMAVSGTFDQLTTCTIFALWLFYGVTAMAVIVLRRRMPDASRPYRAPFYPILPLLFALTAAWLVINTIQTNPLESAAGLGLLLLGLPFYVLLKRG